MKIAKNSYLSPGRRKAFLIIEILMGFLERRTRLPGFRLSRWALQALQAFLILEILITWTTKNRLGESRG
jgi:hypothetical protein